MEKKSNVQTDVKVQVRKRQFGGTVVSVSGKKTIKVRVESVRVHPKYNKQYKQSRSFAVHDEKNVAKVGEMVTIEECRPLSRTKRWFLVTK